MSASASASASASMSVSVKVYAVFETLEEILDSSFMDHPFVPMTAKQVTDDEELCRGPHNTRSKRNIGQVELEGQGDCPYCGAPNTYLNSLREPMNHGNCTKRKNLKTK